MRFQNGAKKKKTHAVKFENGANLELTSAKPLSRFLLLRTGHRQPNNFKRKRLLRRRNRYNDGDDNDNNNNNNNNNNNSNNNKNDNYNSELYYHKNA